MTTAVEFWSNVIKDANASSPYAQVAAQCTQTMYSAAKRMEADRYTVVAALQKRTFYRTVDFNKIVSGVQAMLTKSKNELSTLRAEDWGAHGALAAIDEELLQLYRRINESIPYTQNYNFAVSRGIEVIDAPGLWRWVEKSLSEIELTTGLIAYVACVKPIWLSVVQWLYQAAQVLISIARAAAEVVIDLAVAAGKGILKIPDTLGTVWTIAKWGAIIGGGLWAASKIRGDASVGAMLSSITRRGSK